MKLSEAMLKGKNENPDIDHITGNLALEGEGESGLVCGVCAMGYALLGLGMPSGDILELDTDGRKLPALFRYVEMKTGVDITANIDDPVYDTVWHMIVSMNDTKGKTVDAIVESLQERGL